MSVATRPPVVIMGMHRSGTTAVASALAQLGLYVGARLDPNAEAWFFLKLNEWLLREAGATWDRPAPVRELLSQDRLRDFAIDYAERTLRSPRSISYLGLRGLVTARWPGGLTQAWGWKDPRNTFTLPLWLDLFPNAAAVHVVRHGVDVAASLQRRAEESQAELAARYGRRPRFSTLRGHSRRLVDSVRCTTLEGAFSLWEEYAAEGHRHVASLGSQAAEVRFEDLVTDPVAALDRLAQFCGLETDRDQLIVAASKLHPERARAYQGDQRLARYAAEVDSRLAAHGYAA